MATKQYGLFIYIEGQDHPEYIHWRFKRFTRVVLKEHESELEPVLGLWNLIAQNEKTVEL